MHNIANVLVKWWHVCVGIHVYGALCVVWCCRAFMTACVLVSALVSNIGCTLRVFLRIVGVSVCKNCCVFVMGYVCPVCVFIDCL